MWSSTFLNESGNRPVPLPLSGEERLQFCRDDPIQHRRLGSARAVCDADGHDAVATGNSGRNSPPNVISGLHGPYMEKSVRGGTSLSGLSGDCGPFAAEGTGQQAPVAAPFSTDGSGL
jgi:hypothetical protein